MATAGELRDGVRDYVTAADDGHYASVLAGLVALNITHSNLVQQMMDERFPMDMTVGRLKLKLYQHTGTPADSQRVLLKSGSTVVRAGWRGAGRGVGGGGARAGLGACTRGRAPFVFFCPARARRSRRWTTTTRCSGTTPRATA